MVDAGDNTYGGKYVVNPSGGLISKGHPLGATGLAQCTELSWQVGGASQSLNGSQLLPWWIGNPQMMKPLGIVYSWCNLT